jgi:RNA polymerase sigma-70 factor (ECF subfamily)
MRPMTPVRPVVDVLGTRDRQPDLAAGHRIEVTATREPPGLGCLLESHRRELTGHCCRMLGSAFEAEDAVQETLIRACRGFGGFEGRASLRSWLYRVATNVCFDMLRGRQRRPSPIGLGPSWSAGSPPGTLEEPTWIEPVPDGRVRPASGDPAELVASREAIRLAFATALQHLPARQRAVLVLREVLGWKANEVAELLGSTVASVNSALQRARSTLAASDLVVFQPAEPLTLAQRRHVARCVDALERPDAESLVSLLLDEARSQVTRRPTGRRREPAKPA